MGTEHRDYMAMQRMQPERTGRVSRRGLIAGILGIWLLGNIATGEVTHYFLKNAGDQTMAERIARETVTENRNPLRLYTFGLGEFVVAREYLAKSR